MPPSFFLMAHSFAPESTGTSNCGTSPLSMTFTRSVKVDRRRDPASAEPWATNDRSSSTKRHDCLSNIFLRGNCRNYRPIRWVGKAKGRRVLFVSLSCGAKPYADASSLTAPLASPSANLAATLLFRVSSPPRTPSLLLVVTFTAGRSVPSINRATCCLTSVESEICLTPPYSPGYPKPQ